MADYDYDSCDSPASRRAAPIPLKILAVGRDLPLGELRDHVVEHERSGDKEAFRARLGEGRPDILVLDAAVASRAFADAIAESGNRDLPVILYVGDGAGNADNAGLFLDNPVQFVAASDDGLGLLVAVERAAATIGQHAADSSSVFEHDHRIQSLKRDAERVAAALSELAAARPAGAERPVDAGRIRAHIKARRLRERFFRPEIFADPAWDMLLDLAAARLEGRMISVSSLCIAANVPTTTALRWIKNLCDEGLFQRSADPTDARRAFIGLSTLAAERIDACLDACLNYPGQ